MNLKAGLFFYIFLLALIGRSQTLELTYEPIKPIIKFNIESTSFYSDSSSVFSIYESRESKISKEYYLEVRKLLQGKLSLSINDTISIEDGFVRFDDIGKSWNIHWILIRLIENDRVKMYDDDAQLVEKIVIKRKKFKHRKGRYKVFYNKATKKEVYREKVFRVIGLPKF